MSKLTENCNGMHRGNFVSNGKDLHDKAERLAKTLWHVCPKCPTFFMESDTVLADFTHKIEIGLEELFETQES